jgi:hypothetical protein
LSTIFSDPLRVPIVAGVNVTLMSHFEFGVSATVVEHAGLALAAVVTEKLPEGVNAVNVTLAFPVFVTVTCCAALVVFAFCAAKVSELVESETCRTGATPVPLSGKDCGVFAALSAITTEPVIVPVEVGVNVIRYALRPRKSGAGKERIVDLVGIARSQIRGAGDESDEAPVPGNSGTKTRAVALDSVESEREESRRGCATGRGPETGVAHEHVGGFVSIPGDEVVGV